MRGIGLLCSAILLGACAPREAPGSDYTFNAPGVAATFEALLKESSDTFVPCLRVEQSDPSPAVFASLSALGREVYPASQCTYSTGEPGALHVATGRKAMFHVISGFARVSEGHATVKYESYHHGLYGGGGTCTLHFVQGAWNVSSCVQTHVS